MSHNVRRGSPSSYPAPPLLSDASESDVGTGAPVSRTRRSVLPTLTDLTPKQRKVAFFSGLAAVGLIGLGVVMALQSSSDGAARAATEGLEAPVAAPAPPPMPIVEPRVAEAPPAPPPAISASAASPGRELDEEQKKKDKKKRMGTVAPSGPAASPDYGI